MASARLYRGTQLVLQLSAIAMAENSNNTNEAGHVSSVAETEEIQPTHRRASATTRRPPGGTDAGESGHTE